MSRRPSSVELQVLGLLSLHPMTVHELMILASKRKLRFGSNAYLHMRLRSATYFGWAAKHGPKPNRYTLTRLGEAELDRTPKPAQCSSHPEHDRGPAMTETPYSPYARVTDLSPEQLNEFLARWFGLAPMVNDPMPWKPTWECGTRGTDDYVSYWPGPPAFASKLDLAAEAEARLIAEGHAERYGQTLYLILNSFDGPFDEYNYIGGTGYAALATAPALVRCQAVLEVLVQLGRVQL